MQNQRLSHGGRAWNGAGAGVFSKRAMHSKEEQMKSCFSCIAVFAMALCAVATSAQAGKRTDAAERLSEFERTGEFTNCLHLRSINQIKALDDRHFLVRVGVNDYYLNKPSGRCTGASRPFNRIQYSTSLSQLCNNEIIHIVDNTTGFIAGSCGLNKFERLEPKAAEEDDRATG